jgi:hypothetical protein
MEQHVHDQAHQAPHTSEGGQTGQKGSWMSQPTERPIPASQADTTISASNTIETTCLPESTKVTSDSATKKHQPPCRLFSL